MAPAEKQYVDDADDALAIMLSELGGRFGMAFTPAGEGPSYDGEGSGVRTVSYLLAPEREPSKVFEATVRARADGGETFGGVLCDWPQYLFRDRLLGPFRESLSATAAASGLAGWALTMTYARYDARAWAEDELEEYLGEGRDGDPTVSAILVLPVGADDEACAQAIYAAAGPLYSLGRNLDVVASREGLSPFPRPVYTADIKYTFASSRESGPMVEEIAQSIKRTRSVNSVYSGPETESWDGSTNGGDPTDSAHLPQVTWCPGYGPEA